MMKTPITNNRKAFFTILPCCALALVTFLLGAVLFNNTTEGKYSQVIMRYEFVNLFNEKTLKVKIDNQNYILFEGVYFPEKLFDIDFKEGNSELRYYSQYDVNYALRADWRSTPVENNITTRKIMDNYGSGGAVNIIHIPNSKNVILPTSDKTLGLFQLKVNGDLAIYTEIGDGKPKSWTTYIITDMHKREGY